jgi:protein-S-isoprenylcysteine O-methyltransferase Ste14
LRGACQGASAAVDLGLLLLFAAQHILVAIQLEERDLVATLGDQYSDYRKRVPMLIPGVSLLRSRQQT